MSLLIFVYADLRFRDSTLRADGLLNSASSLGMMSEEEKKTQRIEDIKELLS